jgi:hypothetical protein
MIAERNAIDGPMKTFRTIRIARLWLAVALVLYFLLSMRLPAAHHSPSSKALEIAVVCLSLSCANSAFYINRKYIRKAMITLKDTPEDAKALKRWRVGYVTIYVLSFAVALYGMVLHFFGAPGTRVIPFFAAGGILILYFRPRPIITHAANA